MPATYFLCVEVDATPCFEGSKTTTSNTLGSNLEKGDTKGKSPESEHGGATPICTNMYRHRFVLLLQEVGSRSRIYIYIIIK